jgi:hypothetical protein
MSMPGFTADAAVYRSTQSYTHRGSFGRTGASVVPAMPLCSNCGYVCYVCETTGRVCGGCALCQMGVCDPRSQWEL